MLYRCTARSVAAARDSIDELSGSRAQVAPEDVRRAGRAGARRHGADQRARQRAGCTTRICSPARAASARPPSRASSPRASTASNGVTATPCGVCAACRDIDAGRFVDLLELDAASNTGIDNMREILDNARYAPTAGRYKVYLIDEVHMLSKAGVQLDAEDARGAARARQVRARDDRSAEDPGHGAVALPAVQPEAARPPTLVGARLDHILDAGRHRARRAARRADRARGAGLDARRAVAARPGDRLRRRRGAGAGRAHDARRGRPRVPLPHRRRARRRRRPGAARRGRRARASAACRSPSRSTSSPRCSIASRSRRSCPAPPRRFDDAERVAAYAARFTPETVQLAYQICAQGRADLALAPDEATGFAMTLLRLLAFEPARAATADAASATPAAAAAPRAPRRRRRHARSAGGTPRPPRQRARRRAAPAPRVAPRAVRSRRRVPAPRRPAGAATSTAARRRDAPRDVPRRRRDAVPLPAPDDWPAFVARPEAHRHGGAARGADRAAHRVRGQRAHARAARVAQASRRQGLRRQAQGGARARRRPQGAAGVRGRRRRRRVAGRAGEARARRGEGEAARQRFATSRSCATCSRASTATSSPTRSSRCPRPSTQPPPEDPAP